MTKYSLDHISLLVSDLQASISHWKSILKVDPGPIEEIKEQKVFAVMFELDNVKIELICPFSDNENLLKRADGLHHISLKTDSIEEDAHRLKDLGLKLATEISTGVEGSKTFFVHPKSNGGVLLEFSQST